MTPITWSALLACPAAHAYDFFTQRIGSWWLPAFTASGDQLSTVVVEDKPGGRIYEVNSEGGHYDWGTVWTCTPGEQLAASWTLGVRHGGATRVEVTFTEAPHGTEFRFSHTGWQSGQETDHARFADPGGGWQLLLQAFKTAVADSQPP